MASMLATAIRPSSRTVYRPRPSLCARRSRRKRPLNTSLRPRSRAKRSSLASADDALRRLLLHEPEHVAGDPAHLDLLAAFGDPVAAVVPVDVLEGRVPRVAEAPVDLHRPVGGLAAKAIGPVVAHRHLVGH